MGFGSSILTDDGIALKIIDRLQEKLPLSLFDFKKDNLISLEVLEEISGYRKIILIDAMTDEEVPIGHLRNDRLEDFVSSIHLYNIHDLSIHHLNELAKYLNYEISSDIQIITINIMEKEEFSALLSEKLVQQFNEICVKVEKIVNGVDEKTLG